jgi:hypothetical protein
VNNANILAEFEITPKVQGDIATGLLDGVDDVRLVHHVPLSKRNELLEIVGEQLASNVKADREKGEIKTSA